MSTSDENWKAIAAIADSIKALGADKQTAAQLDEVKALAERKLGARNPFDASHPFVARHLECSQGITAAGRRYIYKHSTECKHPDEQTEMPGPSGDGGG